MSGICHGAGNVCYQKSHYRHSRRSSGCARALHVREPTSLHRDRKEHTALHRLGIRGCGGPRSRHDYDSCVEEPFTAPVNSGVREKDEPSANAGGSLLFREHEARVVRADDDDCVHRLVPRLPQQGGGGKLLLVAEADAEPFFRDVS